MTSEVEELKQRFGLTYHVDWCFDCDRRIGLAGKDVLEVGGSLPAELTVGTLKSRSWTSIEEPTYYQVQTEKAASVLAGIARRHPTPVADAATPEEGSAALLLGAVEELPPHLHSCFDVAFSVATLEHLLHLPRALESIACALRPGGHLYFLASPVWSGPNGHHIPPIDVPGGDELTFNKCPIPRHGHLLHRPAQLYRLLREELDHEVADEVVYYVYHSAHINRLFAEDYLHYLEQCSMEHESVEFVGHCRMDEDVQRDLERLHPGRKQFSATGIVGVMRRPA